MRGSVGISDSSGAMSSVCTICLPGPLIDKQYAAYVIRVQADSGYPKALARGVREGGADFRRWETLAELPLPVPPIERQRALVVYLERETAKIDALVDKQERLIETLAERRQAVISLTIARGLSDHDSREWTRSRLRFHLRLNPATPDRVRAMAEQPVPFIAMEAIGTDGTIDQRSSRPVHELLAGYSYFEKDDLLMAKVTPCFENGKFAIASNLSGSVGFGTTEVTVIRPDSSLNVEYLQYVIRSDSFRRGGIAAMTGAGGLRRVPDSYLRNSEIALPPVSVQAEIVEHLNLETAQIDALSAKAREMIDVLKERRKALISAAVTGKLDARGLA